MTDSEVYKIILSLNNTKSVGLDGISTHVLKYCANVLSPILKHLINLSFTEGTFPEPLKISTVRPLYKKNSKEDINNYRPITLIPILSKIFEKAMYHRLSGFFEKYNIIKNEQNGFQKKKSTTLATFNLIRNITENIDRHIPVSVIFFDMTRAFDFVDHEILLKKCERYGIRGPALDWIKNYLLGRKQCVELKKVDKEHRVNTYRSEFQLNSSGVPQGSILGPLLFLLYINDLPTATKHQCILFADDISVVVPHNPKSVTHEMLLQSAVENILCWLDKNKLCVNLSKTKYVNFSNYKSKPNNVINLTCRGHAIEKVNEMKFLGLVLDSHCNWKGHVSYICKKLNKYVYLLKKLKRTSLQKTALLAYHGFVVSLLRYGLLLWGNSTDVKQAFIIQKKCLRALCGVGPLTSCRPLFKKLNLLTLTSLYILQAGIFVKEQHTLFEQMKNDKNSIVKKRDPTRLILPKCKSALFQKNCYLMTIRIFNKIPKCIRELPINQFKCKLYRWLLEHCFYDIHEFLR